MPPGKSQGTALQALITNHRPDMKPFEETYRNLHSSPELSGEEKQTSALVADHLKRLGFDVHTHIGGYGVAGILENGPGPTVLLRADMDALPVEEQTGLPYASKRKVKRDDGPDVPVMHACGHDSHITCLMAAAELLRSARDAWAGTLVCVFQPAEEQLCGAQAMLDDGLYEKEIIPKPDVVLAQHVMRTKTGTVSLRAGRFLTAADAFDVRIFGRGGHGGAPQTSIDPIVMGSSIVTRLQSIVSREVTPGETAVVTCGCIQAGNAPNMIPDHLDLKLNVRSYDPSTRKRVLESIRRIIEAECEASGAPKKPEIKCLYSSPSTVNDEGMVKELAQSFEAHFGKEKVSEAEPATESEDVSLLATAVGAPYVMWTFGSVDEKTWDDAVSRDATHELPNNHSPLYAPVIQPTLQTGVDAMAAAALTFLKLK